MAFLSRCLVVLAFTLLPSAIAQSVAPTNETIQGNGTPTIHLAVGADNRQYTIWNLTVVGGFAANLDGIQGPLVSVTVSNYLQTRPGTIALISCDPLAGNIQPDTLIQQVAGSLNDPIVLYSETANQCSLASSTVDWRIYTLPSISVSDLLGSLNKSSGTLSATIGAIPSSLSGPATSNGTGPASSSGSNLPPSPSTTVAMIILYSITGVITALFLAIIITGAVRAHRHPERYGPRNGVGRPRQSRARGLAKAMLDTLPIVRFGEREERSKAVDVELADGANAHGSLETTAGPQDLLSPETNRATQSDGPDDIGPEESAGLTTGLQGGGIAAAASHEHSSRNTDHQGCSICTDDFEVGQDQRVLPCDHRFHPACIDPWLLNVSGTCPLCRIDLRPNARASLDSAAAGDDLAPPLESDTAHNRRSARRSTIFNILGTRPGNMTREQRVAALREIAQSQRRQGDSSQGPDELGMRQRLRNAFHVRTRRTGENGRSEDLEPSNDEVTQRGRSS